MSKVEAKSQTEVCDNIMKKNDGKPIEEQLYELVKNLSSEKKTSNYINGCVERLVSTKKVNKKKLGLNKIGKFDNPKEGIKTFIKKFESKKAKLPRNTSQPNNKVPIKEPMQKIDKDKSKILNSSELFDPVYTGDYETISGVNPKFNPGTDNIKNNSPVNDFESARSQSSRRNPPKTISVVRKGGKTRKNSWIQFVKKVQNDEKKKNKNFTYKEAMQTAASMK